MVSITTIFYEILCYSTPIILPYSYQFAGWTGVILYTFTIHLLSVVLDFFISPTAGENVDRITGAYKVPRFAIYCLMLSNLIGANVLVVSLLILFDAVQPQVPPLDMATMIRLLGSLALYWTISEITFTAGHVWLHHTKIGGRIHKLHHLCRRISWSSNLLFHPLDLAVEFGGPFLSMPLMHIYIIQDPFAFRAAIILLYIWYAADHSENLGLSHSIHHLSLGSKVLTIYGRYEWFERLMSNTKKA